jgi:hypothetical protein
MGVERSVFSHHVAKPDRESAWRWPDSLDALIAAPQNHTLLLENENVRVLDTCIAPGERTPLHTHRWPSAMYVLSWSSFVRYGERGEVLLDSRQALSLANPPQVIWSQPLPPHTLENVGNTDLRVISVELK